MKRNILCVFAVVGCLVVGCSDDDVLTNEYVECEIIEDVGIKELLSILEQTQGIYVTENALTYEDANATNNVHNVHYFGIGADNKIDVNLYRTAYEKGHYFLVSERNVDELCEILDCELSVDITAESIVKNEDISGIWVESTPLNFPDNPYDTTDDDWDGIIFEQDSAIVDFNVVEEIVESDYYMLFNENMQMIVAVPLYNHIPHLIVDAMADAIYKYQDDAPESRASENLVPASDPVLFTWTRNFDYYKPDGKTKIHSNSQTVTASYIISGCYSYSANRDYYMIQQEVVTYNSQLETFKKVIDKFDDGDDYYVYAGYAHGVKIEASLGNWRWCLGTPDNNKFHLLQMSPQTTIGSASVTTGISYNIGGNVGLSLSGPEAGLSSGVTFSDSRTMNIPDVEVCNYCLSGEDGKMNDARYACWKFNIAHPNSEGDYFNTKHCRWQIDDVPKIGSSTATYMASHLWAIDNPKEGFDPCITIAVTPIGGVSAGYQTWLGGGYTWRMSRSCPGYHHRINLNVPKRD